MAKRKSTGRIEPTFDGPSRGKASGGFSVSEEDRAVPSRRKSSARRKAPRGRKRQGRGGLLRGLGRLVYWAFVLAIWCGIGGAGLVVYYAAKMPTVTAWTIPDRAPNIRIVSADGALLANRGMTGGEALGLHEMSAYIPKAVIAIEDRRFYSHFGIDPLGLARAVVQNVTSGRVSQGGSTLTQQLAKNLFLTPDRTLERKVQEVLLALWLEHKHSKDQILEMYLNRVYFGSGAYGVEAASRRYFNKSARDVTLAEAATLAGLLKAPSRLSPARDPKAADARAQLVLAAMRDQGMIGDKQLMAAMSAPSRRAPSYWTGSEQYVADRVVEELPQLIGEVRSDIVVETTVDMGLQKVAEKSIRDLVDGQGKKLNVTQGALVSIDGNGGVRAMVGGTDYASSQFDRASEARRQPGSAFKPFVYLAAVEEGRTPDSVRNDAPIRIGKWTPDNYRGKYYGKVTLATALAKSLNSVAAQLAMEVGPKTVVDTAHRLGIESSLQANVSIALGTSEVTPLELTAAYVPFANGGFRPEVYFIRRVRTLDGAVLYEHRQGAMPRVLRPEIVGMMNAMMSGTLASGTAQKAAFGWPAAGKTGTSQNSRDAWFVGYTADLTTGVWFGNDDGSPMRKVTGGMLPAAAWHDFMAAAHKGKTPEPLPGRWEGGGSGGEAPVPMADVGDEDDTLAAVGRRLDAIPADSGPDDGRTASIRRPAADVGAPSKKETSLLDIIMGDSQ
ncbi:MAG: penicillin-binding protein [Rhizobiales bacterium]|nr:penicillin-binding protein [Hyphomicrobiales bacterium]